MRPFTYERASNPAQAAAAAARRPEAKFVAGGTNLLDLMKLEIERPRHLIDVNGLSLDKINKPITYYGRPTLTRVATTYTLNDLHEHLGQLVSYARMNQIVPPWSRKTG